MLVDNNIIKKAKGKPGKSRGRKATGSKAFSDVMIAWLPKTAQGSALSIRGQTLALFSRLLTDHLDIEIPAFAPGRGERGISMGNNSNPPAQRWK